MDTTFKIDNETLQANIDLDANSISIKSNLKIFISMPNIVFFTNHFIANTHYYISPGLFLSILI